MSPTGSVVLDGVTKVYDPPGRTLSDVSVEIAPGGGLGIVGHNGAGKSTLTRLVAGVTQATSGTVAVRGRVAGQLEAGVGFHPELTGRENLRFAARLHGLSTRDLRRLAPAILEFAGLADAIDAPVKGYSTGMRARLSFALVSHVPADVLVLDEGLAAGDAAFRVRAAERLAQLRAAGTTFVFVSHWLGGLVRLTDEAIRLERGVVADRGAPAEVVARYRGAQPPANEPESGPVRVHSAWVEPNEIGARESVRTGATLVAARDDDGLTLRLRVASAAGALLADSAIGPVSELAGGDHGTYDLDGLLPTFPLEAGRYALVFAAVDEGGEVRSRSTAWLTVRGPVGANPRVSLEHTWHVEPAGARAALR